MRGRCSSRPTAPCDRSILRDRPALPVVLSGTSQVGGAGGRDRRAARRRVVRSRQAVARMVGAVAQSSEFLCHAIGLVLGSVSSYLCALGDRRCLRVPENGSPRCGVARHGTTGKSTSMRSMPTGGRRWIMCSRHGYYSSATSWERLVTLAPGPTRSTRALPTTTRHGTSSEACPTCAAPSARTYARPLISRGALERD